MLELGGECNSRLVKWKRVGFLPQNKRGKRGGAAGPGKGVEGEGEGGCLCHRWLLQGLRWNKDDNRAVDSKIGVRNGDPGNKNLQKNKRGFKICGHTVVVRQKA